MFEGKMIEGILGEKRYCYGHPPKTTNDQKLAQTPKPLVKSLFLKAHLSYLRYLVF